MTIGFAGAFLGGILTLVSPCSALLLPAFFAYAFSSTRDLLGRSFVFYLGLITTLVPIGAFAGTLGSLLTVHRSTFIAVAAGIVVLFGALQLIGVKIPLLQMRMGGGSGLFSTYVLGLMYGVAGACAGPILGSILMVAALGGSSTYGAALLAVYALGMVIPLFILAALWDRFEIGKRGWLKPRTVHIGRWSNTVTDIISGTLFVVLGVVLYLTDGTASLAGPVGVSTQFELEMAATQAGSSIGNTAFLVIIGVALVAFIWWRVRTRSAATRRSDRRDKGV